jgi:hypothetical protein
MQSQILNKLTPKTDNLYATSERSCVTAGSVRSPTVQNVQVQGLFQFRLPSQIIPYRTTCITYNGTLVT